MVAFAATQKDTVVDHGDFCLCVSSANFNYIDTYLVSHIKIIEEVCLARIWINLLKYNTIMEIDLQNLKDLTLKAKAKGEEYEMYL